jgi:hypothetical protein
VTLGAFLIVICLYTRIHSLRSCELHIVDPPVLWAMSSPPSPSDSRRQSLLAAASAAERRAQEKTPDPDILFGAEREKRQTFRRLIDPGIMRPNGREQAMESLKVPWGCCIVVIYRVLISCGASPQILSTLAKNLLREPENAKFQQFKPTNETIKKKIVERAGVLEYAIAVSVDEWTWSIRLTRQSRSWDLEQKLKISSLTMSSTPDTKMISE